MFGSSPSSHLLRALPAVHIGHRCHSMSGDPVETFRSWRLSLLWDEINFERRHDGSGDYYAMPFNTFSDQGTLTPVYPYCDRCLRCGSDCGSNELWICYCGRGPFCVQGGCAAKHVRTYHRVIRREHQDDSIEQENSVTGVPGDEQGFVNAHACGRC